MHVLSPIALALALFTAGGPSTPTAAEAIAAGDESFEKIDYPAAIGAYERALSMKQNDPEILWRIARAYVCFGESYDDGRRAELCRKAELAARRCIARNPNLAQGHTWLAGALGYLALSTGMADQARISNEIMAEVDRALALNPNDDAALSIKGSLYRALGNVSWVKRRMAGILLGGIPDGGFEEGEQCLLQATRLAPDVMRHWYELGVLYMDMGKPDKAREAFTHAIGCPVRVAIDIPRKAKAEQYLVKMHDEE